MNVPLCLSVARAGFLSLAAISAFRKQTDAAKTRFALGVGCSLLPGLIPNSSLAGPLSKKFPTREKKVWLTIDDGPGRHDTEQMLTLLKEYRAVASFFVIGKLVEKRRHLARSMAEAGHGVENHSWSHRSGSMWVEPASWVREDVARCSHAIFCATGRSPRFFRAPAGRMSPAMFQAAEANGLLPVGWSAAGGDGMCCGDLWKSMETIIAQLTPGAVILIHQGGRTGRVAALRFLLQRLQADGWRTVLPDAGEME